MEPWDSFFYLYNQADHGACGILSPPASWQVDHGQTPAPAIPKRNVQAQNPGTIWYPFSISRSCSIAGIQPQALGVGIADVHGCRFFTHYSKS